MLAQNNDYEEKLDLSSWHISVPPRLDMPGYFLWHPLRSMTYQFSIIKRLAWYGEFVDIIMYSSIKTEPANVHTVAEANKYKAEKRSELMNKVYTSILVEI